MTEERLQEIRQHFAACNHYGQSDQYAAELIAEVERLRLENATLSGKSWVYDALRAISIPFTGGKA